MEEGRRKSRERKKEECRAMERKKEEARRKEDRKRAENRKKDGLQRKENEKERLVHLILIIILRVERIVDNKAVCVTYFIISSLQVIRMYDVAGRRTWRQSRGEGKMK